MIDILNPYITAHQLNNISDDKEVKLIGELTLDNESSILDMHFKYAFELFEDLESYDYTFVHIYDDPLEEASSKEDYINNSKRFLYTYNYIINGVKTYNEKQPYMQDSDGNYVNFVIFHLYDDSIFHYDKNFIALAICWGDNAALLQYANICTDTGDGVIESNICKSLAAEQYYLPAINELIENYYECLNFNQDIDYETIESDEISEPNNDRNRFYKVKYLLCRAFYHKSYFCKSYEHFIDVKNRIINHKMSSSSIDNYYERGLARYEEYDHLFDDMADYEEYIDTKKYNEYFARYTDDYTNYCKNKEIFACKQFKKYAKIGLEYNLNIAKIYNDEFKLKINK